MAEAAVEAADTALLTIPSQLGVAYGISILESVAQHVAPSLGWEPSFEGPIQGNAI